MVAGAPRKYDREEIAEEILLWANKPDSFSLSKFLGDNNLLYETVWAWTKECKKFSEAYNKAKVKIAGNREVAAGKGELYNVVYALHQRNYDPTIDMNSRADKELDAKLRKEAPEGEVHIHLPSGEVKKTTKKK